MSKKVPDSVFTDGNGQEEIARILGALVGFVSFSVVLTVCVVAALTGVKVTHLNRIVMPDPGDDDDSEEEEDQEDEGDDEEEEDEE